jgi:sugar lactone lactonase YvrE
MECAPTETAASGAPSVWGNPNENGVRFYTPAGELLGKIHVPETVANSCFGGQ